MSALPRPVPVPAPEPAPSARDVSGRGDGTVATPGGRGGGRAARCPRRSCGQPRRSFSPRRQALGARAARRAARRALARAGARRVRRRTLASGASRRNGSPWRSPRTTATLTLRGGVPDRRSSTSPRPSRGCCSRRWRRPASSSAPCAFRSRRAPTRTPLGRAPPGRAPRSACWPRTATWVDAGRTRRSRACRCTTTASR